MRALLLASVGLAVGGMPGAVVGILGHGALLMRQRRRARGDASIRPLLVVLLVELRSGSSALGALQALASSFPDRTELVRASRVATIAGLGVAVDATGGEIRTLVSQLARAQRSGASLSDTVRSMIDADIAAEKSRRVARARTLPVRLMIPISLLVLPGLILLFYAPSLLLLFEQLSEPLA